MSKALSDIKKSISDVAVTLEKSMLRLFKEYTRTDTIAGKDFPLVKAMEYSIFGNSKRIRPFLFLVVARVYKVDEEQALRAAAAIEFIHKYSLIHDDLPCMDNDDYRNGQLTVHKKFNEATAVLAGNALLTLAFEILADSKTHASAEIRCKLIQLVTNAIGVRGLLGGQMYDMSSVNSYNAEELIEIDLLKSAKLFAATCQAGAILGGASVGEEETFRLYGENLGLAYQLADDIEDYSTDKKQSLIIDLLGFAGTKQRLQEFLDRACNNLQKLEQNGKEIEDLQQLVQLVLNKASI